MLVRSAALGRSVSVRGRDLRDLPSESRNLLGVCGIYGMVNLRGAPLRRPDLTARMRAALRHRGPDGGGVLERPEVAIGNQRLRIVDLRKRADQPFTDPETGVSLITNGEIYNAAALRRRYRDRYPFTSRSDVEPVLPLYLDRGVAGMGELDGMFALAIWDPRDRTLVLARDRAGEKPLFFRRAGDELHFASEIQALLLDPSASRELDETAIGQYLTLGYVLEPRTPFVEIHKVEAGTVARFAAGGGERGEVCRYWDPGAIATVELPRAEAEDRLRELLEAAVRKQMIADVPVGVFVSGGIDSSLLATLAAEEIGPDRRLHTFTTRFAAASYDESPWAAQIAHRLGAEHHEVTVDERSLGEALAAVAEQLAEPVADPAILPTYLLAREASRHIKVVLSGEGADELFGGYPTYLGHRLMPWVQALPRPLLGLLRRAAEAVPASRGKVTVEYLLKRFLADAEKPFLARHLAWFGSHVEHLGAGGGDPGAGIAAALADPGAGHARSDLAAAMLLDYRSYLRDNLLVKIDRATMLCSLESRAPFLDKDLTAFALALPDRYRVRGLSTKWLLKRVARERLPKALVDRRKRGLSVPVASWIDHGLSAEVDRLLAPERLRRQELLDPAGVAALLGEHRARRANHAKSLWTLIVLQLWLQHWAPERAGEP